MMYKHVMRRAAAACLFVVSGLFLSGCADLHADMTFKDDGSIVLRKDLSFQIPMQADMAASLNQWKQEDRQNGFTVEDTANGYRSSKTYAGIQDIADTGGEFWTPDPEYGEIRLHKGLLYDYYSIHTRIKGQENAALPQAHYEDNIPNFFQVPSSVDVWSYLEYRKQAEREAAQLNEIHNQAVAAAVNSASLDFTMHLPMAVDATNADQVLDDGKTLVWDLKPAFINTQGASAGQDIHMQAQFRIFHQTTAILLGVVCAALVIAAIVCAVLVKRKQPTGQSKPYLIGLAVSIVCLVGLGGLVQSATARQVTFSDSDRIISKALPEGSAYQTLPSPNSLDSAKAMAKDHTLHGEVVAVSEEDDDGYLALFQTTAGPCFVIADKASDSIAVVPFKQSLIHFRTQYTQFSNGKKSYYPLTFIMARQNDTKDSPDVKLGIWQNDMHQIPTYVLIEPDENDVIHVDGNPSSAWNTLTPSHYQVPMKDEINIRMAKIFANHIDSLSKDVRARDVILPNK
ncbi:hypothetical protein [uncultured Megasphaera sp.]|uniref:hypothetical protein n=1 Tax=uncultured Megasphaera sp. TaxID=165188 RepID=UPI002622BDB9|nr:hypothetical protein [uncultured Megasphaera sp.]